ncbi:hypothetical protein TruAng_010772 [Truncatella angustata]|nr:hypothetical protein TruAng_010772 [Truncatella angustata]
MGKANKTTKHGGASSTPYERPGKGGKAKAGNNIFKFNTSSYGQHMYECFHPSDFKANLKPTDTVLEIGPGTGNLTVKILEKAKKVIAVEVDPRMAAEVTKQHTSAAVLLVAPSHYNSCCLRDAPNNPKDVITDAECLGVQGTPEQRKLEVLMGDVIKLPNDKLPAFDVCISNTPYQISSPLVFKLLSLPNPPRTSVLMFQREFALRLTAKPGDPLYCRLSVNAQCKPTYICVLILGIVEETLPVGEIKENANLSSATSLGSDNTYIEEITNPLQVESSVVKIEPKTGHDRPNVSFEEWDGMLRVCFNRRNKTLRSSWLGTKEVLAMIERNYRLFCSMNDIPLEEGTIEGVDDEDMDLDENVEPSAGDEDVEAFGSMDMDGAAGEEDTLSFFQELKQASSSMPKTLSKRPRSKVNALIREKIRKVLEDDTNLADQRSGKCDENDFLRLLHAFNQENIHFS